MPIEMQSASYAAVKFESVGDSIKGTIVHAEERPYVPFGQTEQATTRAGKPITEWVIGLQTDEHDADNDEDTGLRTLYVNKWRMQQAIATAVKAAGERSIQDGGKLLVRYSSDGKAEAGFNPPKEFDAQYKAPVASVEIPGLSEDELL